LSWSPSSTPGRSTERPASWIAYDRREVGFDLAVVVPLHGGAAYVGRSPGLGDELNFVPTDERTLQSKAAPNVFVIGDAANVPASKAGSVTHFEGETLVENVRRFLVGEPLEPGFDGHANCFIESGFHKALLVDFNYHTEPLPGHFPTTIGLPLLKESRLNHLGERVFQGGASVALERESSARTWRWPPGGAEDALEVLAIAADVPFDPTDRAGSSAILAVGRNR